VQRQTQSTDRQHDQVVVEVRHNQLEWLYSAGDNMTFPGVGYWHHLQATKKQDKEPDKFPSSCQYRIEESKG
jgi:hypothetical protein